MVTSSCLPPSVLGNFNWSFDTNDGVVSLMFQTADEGGHFEYAPYRRDEVNENYGGIQELVE